MSKIRMIKKSVDEFLSCYNMRPEDISIEELVKGILIDMDKGLSGKESSLPMLPTYIETEKEIPSNKPVIVLDAGGTNLRVGLIYFNNEKKPIIEDLISKKMPGTDTEITGNEFFYELAKVIKPYLEKSDSIGFCFSYPSEMEPDRDGKVLKFSKEIKISGIIGKPIGKGLLEAVRNMGYKDKKRVVLLNDTVATLLAGRCLMADRIFDSYIGFIYGTGTNCCYIEKNRNIRKIKNWNKSGEQIINIEAGSFCPPNRGIFEIDVDKKTINPGDYKLEKMIAGRYFGLVCTEAFRKAVKEGLIDKNNLREENISYIEFDTKDVNEFLMYPYSSDSAISNIFKKGSEREKITLGFLFLRLVERASKVAAAVLSAASIKSERGLNPIRPILIVAEGTTYHNMLTLKRNTEFYLKNYLIDCRDVFFEVTGIDNATLIGAAVAGLTN